MSQPMRKQDKKPPTALSATGEPTPQVRYPGERWVEGNLPRIHEPWPLPDAGRTELEGERYDALRSDVARYCADRVWVWPRQTLYFFCDVHADTDALFTSLVASGGVRKTGEGDAEFELTEAGREAKFVVGGDCFDKGPSNLRLLRALKGLVDAGADVEILAGNHDLRTMVGLAYVGRKEPRFAHLFVRMGKKTIPLFQEVWREYCKGNVDPKDYPDEATLREMLIPDEGWYGDFPGAVAGLVPEKKLRKELARIREKVSELQAKCDELGVELWQVYAAVRKCQELFLEPDGEFHWFFERMKLAVQHGSYLFIHAGLGDQTADVLRRDGVDGLNRWFHRMLETDVFELYFGPLGNAFRTKYRDIDYPLSAQGVLDVRLAGVNAIVHGHKNILEGHRVVLRNGLLNFECDCSVDRNTRRIEGLEGAGGAVAVFRPDGRVHGISTDHGAIKVFDPAEFAPLSIV